jgi:hypothetical protein
LRFLSCVAARRQTAGPIRDPGITLLPTRDKSAAISRRSTIGKASHTAFFILFSAVCVMVCTSFISLRPLELHLAALVTARRTQVQVLKSVPKGTFVAWKPEGGATKARSTKAGNGRSI